jgi:hypothetical protein
MASSFEKSVKGGTKVKVRIIFESTSVGFYPIRSTELIADYSLACRA